MTFTTTHKLNQTLALLQQLPGNSDLIPLVLAPLDAGKTSLWQQLCTKAPAHWRLAAISAHEKLTRAQLLRRLVGDWLPGKQEISHSQFLEELKHFKRQGLLPLVAVDDADALAPDVLLQLRQLPIGLIFFAENSPGGSEEGYQILPLSPWNQEEMAAFAKLTRGRVPSNWELDRLLLASDGLPGRLVRLLDDPSAQAVQQQPTETRPQQSAIGARLKAQLLARLNLWLGVLAVVLVLGFGYLLNRERIDEGLKFIGMGQGQDGPAAQSHQPVDLTPGLLLPEADQQTAPAPQRAEVELKLPEMPKEPVENPASATITPPAPTKEPELEPEASLAEPAAEEPSASESIVVERDPQLHKQEQQQLKDSLLHGPEWILQQPAQHYGLQMIELESLDALEAFAKKHKLTKSVPLSWLPAKGGKKAAYLLILGSYPSKQAAAKARLMLPDAINIDKVKLLGFGELHKQIQAK